MIRRPLCITGILFLLGITFSVKGMWPCLAAGIVLAVVFAAREMQLSGRRALMLLLSFAAAVSVGVLRGEAAIRSAERIGSLQDGERITVRGNVRSADDSGKYVKLILDDASVRTEGNGTEDALRMNCLLLGEHLSVTPGTILTASGTKTSFKISPNEGCFDEERYYRSHGIGLKVEDVEEGASSCPVFSVRRLLWNLRNALSSVYANNLPGEEGGLLAALTVGEDSALSEEVSELFRMAGIIHLLSISGTHVSLVAGSAYRALRRMRGSFLLAGAVSSVLAVLYGSMCGNSVSTVRAVMMFCIGMSAAVLGRKPDILTTLSFSAALQTAANPFCIDDTGFLFSYGAVAGLVLFVTPVKDAYLSARQRKWEKTHRTDKGRRWMPSVIEHACAEVIGAAAVQAVTLPLAALCFQEIPTYAAFLNLIFLPVFPFLLVTGLIGGLFTLLTGAGFVLLPCHLILYFFEALSDHAAALPQAALITGRPGNLCMILAFALLFLTGYAVRQRASFVKILPAAAACVMILFPKHHDFSVDILDVGQGDGICITTGEGHTIFTDGGSSDVKDAAEYRILPYIRYRGIRKADCWIVSHCDKDHISGLTELLESGYPVRTLIAAEGMVRDEAWEKLKGRALENGTEIVCVLPGDRITFGSGTEETALTFLYPDSTGQMKTDRNDSCLTFVLTHGNFTGMFQGDLGEEGEQEILSHGFRKHMTLLKAGHHGSDTSNSAAWLDALTPDIALISAGKDNSYGHPGKETMERLHERGISTWITFETGRIRVTEDGGVSAWHNERR